MCHKLCLMYSFTTMKRNRDQRKHLIESLFIVTDGWYIIFMWASWQHAGRHGSGEVVDNFTW